MSVGGFVYLWKEESQDETLSLELSVINFPGCSLALIPWVELFTFFGYNCVSCHG